MNVERRQALECELPFPICVDMVERLLATHQARATSERTRRTPPPRTFSPPAPEMPMPISSP